MELPDQINFIHGGVQNLYFFPNGYGASVTKHSFSYGNENGLWELAVLEGSLDNFSLTYETPIADDVLGYLDLNDVDAILDAIESLPRKQLLLN